MGFFDLFRSKKSAPSAQPDLPGTPPPGTRRVVTLRFENPRPPEIFFREVTLDRRSLRILAGKADETAPDETVRVFDQSGTRFSTEEAARQAYDAEVTKARTDFKRERELLRDLPIPVREGLAPGASNPELEAAVERAAEADIAPASVFADWLQTHGDPRGELAALHLNGKTVEAQAWLEANAEAVLGDLDVKLGTEVHELLFRHGFLAGASLRRKGYDSTTNLSELTRTFLSLPVARFLTRLRFGLASFESDNDWSQTLRAVCESPRASAIRELRFDDYTSEDCELSWTAFGDFSPFWAKLRALEHLHLRSGEGGTLGEIDLPNLRTFIRESGGLSSEEIQSVLRAKWPKLERLDLWLGEENYGAQGSVGLLQPLLDGHVPETLRHLGLVNCEFSQELLPALLTSRLLPRLEVLDLSKGVLLDADVEPLLARPEAVKHLRRLDLSENLLSESVDRLRAALPNVVLDGQRFEDMDEGMRYTAVGE